MPTMDAEIEIGDVAEAGDLSRYARWRLTPIVSHPWSGVGGISVSVDRASDHEAEGIRCRILVRVSPLLRLSVERSDASAHAAIDAAAERLTWALRVYHGMS